MAKNWKKKYSGNNSNNGKNNNNRNGNNQNNKGNNNGNRGFQNQKGKQNQNGLNQKIQNLTKKLQQKEEQLKKLKENMSQNQTIIRFNNTSVRIPVAISKDPTFAGVVYTVLANGEASFKLKIGGQTLTKVSEVNAYLSVQKLQKSVSAKILTIERFFGRLSLVSQMAVDEIKVQDLKDKFSSLLLSRHEEIEEKYEDDADRVAYKVTYDKKTFETNLTVQDVDSVFLEIQKSVDAQILKIVSTVASFEAFCGQCGETGVLALETYSKFFPKGKAGISFTVKTKEVKEFKL